MRAHGGSGLRLNRGPKSPAPTNPRDDCRLVLRRLFAQKKGRRSLVKSELRRSPPMGGACGLSPRRETPCCEKPQAGIGYTAMNLNFGL